MMVNKLSGPAKQVNGRRGVRTGLRILTAAVLIGVVPTPQYAQTGQAEQATVATNAMVLRPGDVIRLRIWREPDLSGEFPVDERGVVVFPKIGPYTVTDESPDALKARLVQAYRRYLRNPSIDITLMRRVTIMGEVRSPGAYQVDATMTLADAIALAGGSTSSGDANEIELYRGGEKLDTRFDQRTLIGDTPIRSGDYIYVPEKNWLERNSGVATLFSTGVSLFIAVFLR